MRRWLSSSSARPWTAPAPGSGGADPSSATRAGEASLHGHPGDDDERPDLPDGHHRPAVADLHRAHAVGATISIQSFYLSSSITWPALRAAYRRGVHVRAVLLRRSHPAGRWRASSEGVKLRRPSSGTDATTAVGGPGWCGPTHGPGRGRRGTGDARQGGGGGGGGGRGGGGGGIGGGGGGGGRGGALGGGGGTDLKLYGDVQSMFASARDRRDGLQPQRRVLRSGLGRVLSRRPHHARERPCAGTAAKAIPATPTRGWSSPCTSMQGRRGGWLARRLASMVERGADLTFVVGPDVRGPVVRRSVPRARLSRTGAGGPVVRGRRTPATHDKEMTATGSRRGEAVRRLDRLGRSGATGPVVRSRTRPRSVSTALGLHASTSASRRRSPTSPTTSAAATRSDPSSRRRASVACTSARQVNAPSRAAISSSNRRTPAERGGQQVTRLQLPGRSGSPGDQLHSNQWSASRAPAPEDQLRVVTSVHPSAVRCSCMAGTGAEGSVSAARFGRLCPGGVGSEGTEDRSHRASGLTGTR